MVRVIKDVRLILKYLVPWFLRAVRIMFFSMAMAASSIWVGIPKAVDRISNHIVSEAVYHGMPNSFDQVLYWLSCGVAIIEIMFSWILLSYVTMFLLQFIF